MKNLVFLRSFGVRLRMTAALIFLFLFVCHPAYAETILFQKTDRILIIAPHPDDEALGTSGVIQSALEAGASVKIVYLTHGDHNEIAAIFYQKKPLLLKSDFIKSGRAREAEALKAMSALGIQEKELLFLGYPDFGTMMIWKKHWGNSGPFTSFPTGIRKVPYENDFSYENPYLGDSIVSDFEKILLLVRPTHVFVTPPFDLNSDHRAAYLYFNLAWLGLEEKLTPPKVYLYPVHVPKWPAPRKYLPDRPLEPPAHIERGEQLEWTSCLLKPEQVIKKKEALGQYKSQIAYSRNFLLSFVRKNEIFLKLPYETVLENDSPVPPGERDAFNDRVAGEDVEYKIRGGEFWVDARLSNLLDRIGGVNVDIFSYKKGTPFSKMPKLTVGFFAGHIFVKDRGKTLYHAGVICHMKKNKIWTRIPMGLLKDPDALFVSTHAVNERLSLDFGSWRILEIKKS